MSDNKTTLGSAIDAVLNALEPLDTKARETVLATVKNYLGIAGAKGVGGTSDPPLTQTESPRLLYDQNGPKVVKDIRSLKLEKDPATAVQMACLVAYYLAELAAPAERQDTVTAPILEKYFKQAGFKLPKHFKQLLIDGKNSGCFDHASAGAYKLNPVGHNLVVHSLPKKAKE